MKTILFRVDGGIHQDIGTGHIARSILLANRLKERYKIEFISLNEDGFEYGHEKIKNAGFSLKLIASIEYLNNLKSLIIDFWFLFLVEEVYKEIGDSEKSLLAELVIMTLTAINSLLRSPNRYSTRTASLQAVVRPLLQYKEDM